MEPLERHKERLIVFGARGWSPDDDRDFRRERGISIKCATDLPSGGHGINMTLTGAPAADFDGFYRATAPSIDQTIANGIGDDLPFRSLELGVRVGGADSGSKRLVFRDAGTPLPAENEPAALFERLFGSLTHAPDQLERARIQRERVADFLHRRFSTLRPRLDMPDRRVLDGHIATLHELEERAMSLGGRACVAPTVGEIGPGSWDDYANMPAIMEAQLDILASAFSCDLTRVATVQITEGGSNARYRFLSGPDGRPIEEWHHSLSHEQPSNLDAMAKLTTIARWHNAQLALLMDRLEAIPDVDGRTVLDNTVILCVNELSDGRYHTHQNMPWMLAGGGGLRTGRYLQVEDVAHNDLLLACVHLMGVEADYVGSPEYTTGPMSGLT